MIPIVDTHQHLWDLSRFTLPWIRKGSGPPLEASYTPVEYAEATKGLHVVKAVYMEVGMSPVDSVREAEYVISLCESGQTPTCAAVIAGDPASAGFTEYLDRFKGSKWIKGIRFMLHVDGVRASDALKPEFLKGLQRLGERGLSFDLCIRPQELPDIRKIVAACPGTRFILDHCGNPQASFTVEERAMWKQNMITLAANQNVVCKISGLVVNGFKKGVWKAADLAPYIDGTLDAFGPDRVMFGGDWPVVTQSATYAEWVEALKSVVSRRGEDEQRKLFHDNAVKYYGLA